MMDLVDFLVRLGKAFARLGEGRICLGEPVIVPVWGRFHGLVCDCLWLASGPLYDLFESVIS